MAFYVIISLCSFVITLLGTRVIILALRNRVQPLDIATLIGKKKPSAPNGGGIAMVIALMICLLVADIDFAPIVSIFLLVCTYQLHQIIPIPALARFLVQVLAVMVSLTHTDLALEGGAFPPIVDEICITAMWLWFMRQFSAMDRLDGLCSVQGAAIGGGLCLMIIFAGTFPNALSTYGMIVGAACVGFMWWNWHPAKVRMGEVGSVPLGFLLGYLLLLAYQSGYEFALLILPAYILADGLVTGLRRKDAFAVYYFERAVKHGHKAHNVVRLIAGINMLTAFLATRTTFDLDIAIVYMALAYLSVFMLMGYFEHERHSNTHTAHT